MKLQIHHFYDIIRDFGSGKSIKPHEYGHSYHKIANLLQQNLNFEIEIVLGCDDVCVGCSHQKDDHCLDTVNHRPDFHSKEIFNDYINARIMKVCGIKAGNTVTPLKLCKKAESYIENIEWIYEGNDKEHTQNRKALVISGIEKYKMRKCVKEEFTMGTLDFVKQRVSQHYWKDDLNCATTMLKTLAEYFSIDLNKQVIDSAIGMHGAGKYGAQCGLVEGTLMFLGIWGRKNNIRDKAIVDSCKEFAKRFEHKFKSLQCKILRPEGFHPNNPPHLCEPITCDAVTFSINFITSLKENYNSN